MKSTVLISIVLSFSFSLLFSNKSFSQISIQSAKGYGVNVNIQPEEILHNGKKSTYGYNYNTSYTSAFTGNNAPWSLYIIDYKNHDLALLNAGRNILFSTTLSKASVELPSLATGVYFVRVKNKVSGEATNLYYFKI